MSFPTTRYQGSKSKLVSFLQLHILALDFKTVLDVFSGSASVSYLCKKMGKTVFSNDYLKSNYQIAKALVENNHTTLTDEDVAGILRFDKNINNINVIAETFADIYFTAAENKWLDSVVTNIHALSNPYKQALAWFALFQACISKRPYNLFHRKNLYIRKANVERSFGNKTTWEKNFAAAFCSFVCEANHAVFDNGAANKAYNQDALLLQTDQPPDLVYIDSPYINAKGTGVDYHAFYHFLEGVLGYADWKNHIDYKSKHKRLKLKDNPWSQKEKIHQAFKDLFCKYRAAQMVISYRDNGLPAVDELVSLLKDVGKKTAVHYYDYQYVLSKQKSREVLIVAT